MAELNPQMIIQTVCNWDESSRKWSEEKRSLHINVMELLAIKLLLFSFTHKSHTLSDGKQGTLALPLENGRNKGTNIWSN